MKKDEFNKNLNSQSACWTQRERLRTEICELTRMKFKSSLNLSLKLSVFPFIFLVLCYSIGFKF
ncbi:unnamed protein product [Brassica rapa subsp. trilocularis]